VNERLAHPQALSRTPHTMKFLCAVVLCAVALQLVASENAVARLKDQITAQQLGSSSSMPIVSSGSSSIIQSVSSGSISMGSSSMGSSSIGSSSCGTDPCAGSASLSDAPLNVEDALRPVGDWIKDFKRKTTGAAGGNDLYAAAHATVAPLIAKLKKNQQAALDQLRESNEAILRHVEDATTQHIYSLLKVDHEKQSKEEEAQSSAAKAKDLKELEQLRTQRDAAVLGKSSVSASADVVSKIASIIASASQGK